MKELWFDTLESPLGTILLVVDGERLCALDYEEYRSRMLLLLTRHYGEFHLRAATDPAGYRSCVERYLAGEYAALGAIPVNTGGTPFQQRVWQELRAIPVGTTCTYGELATRIGRPTAARAVGHANGQNPVAIVIPCHRVIGSNAALTGYAGGLARKRWLLQHEGILVKDQLNMKSVSLM